MVAPADCPSQDQLRDFARGIVSEADSIAIADHLDHCVDCERTVDGIELRGDTLVGAILHPAIEDPYAEESGCRRVEALVRDIGSELSRGTRRVLAEAEADQLLLAQLGPYQLLEKIGSGGMGTVYKAVHRKLDKVLALKVLPKSRTQDPAAVARFEREVRAVGKLDHPHIVRATDAGEWEGIHYLVMELVDGLDLATLVKHHRRLPVEEACELIRQASLGLQEAYRHGMVHRDIKPSNLMLARSPRSDEPPIVKLLDLGLARLAIDTRDEALELTTAEHVVGTIDYMAPEQFTNSHHVDIRADLYGLGATLYKLLTGEPPYPSSRYQTRLAKLAALAHDDIEPIPSRRPDVPASLATIVARLLARNPAERFATPLELSHALQPFCRGHDLGQLWPGSGSTPDAATDDGDTSTLSTSAARTNDRTTSAFDASARRQQEIGGQTAGGPNVATPRRRTVGWMWWAIVALLGAAIMITITRPDGSKQEVIVPADSRIEITQRTTVEESQPASEADPAVDSAALSDGLSRRQEGEPLPTEMRDAATRRAVVWVLSIGGKVREIRRSKATPIRSAGDLPSGDFALEVDLLQNRKITDAGLENLRHATSIRILNLDGTTISSLEPLATLTGLESLTISIGHLDAEDLRVLILLRSLKHLSVGTYGLREPTPSMTDAAFAVVCQLSQLESLGFGSTAYPLSDGSLAQLQQMQQLKVLGIRSGVLTDQGMMSLPALPELMSLSLDCPRITGLGLSQLNKFTGLTILNVGYSGLSDEELAQIPELPALRELCFIYSPKLTGEGFSSLKVLPQLTRLTLHHCAVTDAGIEQLAIHQSQLQRLGLAGSTQLTDAGLFPLTRLDCLESLDLGGASQVTDAALPTLQRLASLRYLRVTNTQITTHGVASLCRALPDASIDD